MKVEVLKRDVTDPDYTARIDLRITSTGKPGDDVNLPDGLTSKPYNGPYTIDWGDGTPWQVAEQVDNNPLAVWHSYGLRNLAYRIRVRGDATVILHALASPELVVTP